MAVVKRTAVGDGLADDRAGGFCGIGAHRDDAEGAGGCVVGPHADAAREKPTSNTASNT